MIEINIVESHLDELEKRLMELEKSTSFVGYDQSQGTHKESKMTYPNMIALHSAGVPSKNIPARPVFDIAARSFDFKKSGINKAMKKYFKNIKSKPLLSSEDVNKVFVKGFAKEVTNTFGDPNKLESNSDSTINRKKGRNTPLVDTKELMNNLGYSINNKSISLVKNIS